LSYFEFVILNEAKDLLFVGRRRNHSTEEESEN